MRRRVLLLAPALLPALLLLSAARAEACTCGGPGAPCEAFGGAAAVFVGTVTGITNRPREVLPEGEEVGRGPRTVRFSVREAFSGVEGAEVEVSTGLGGGDCGFNFVQGSTYLVYAYGSAGGRRLGTGICTRTRPAFGASEDLEYLRGLAGAPAGVTVHGAVERQPVTTADGSGVLVVGLEGMRVTVEGGGARREVLTDARGRYRLTGISPGTYKVTLRLPEELTTYQPEREVTVADRGCALVSFYVNDNGRIAGRVLDAKGKPVPRLNVTVVDADGRNPDISRYGRHAQTDAEGRYRFEELPPGRYLLGVRLVELSQQDDQVNAYARTYYPGVARAEEAEVLELAAGGELKGRDLRLPPRRAESVIRGRVVWSDGAPVSNAVVAYRDVTYADTRINHTVNADERGEFAIKTYAGSAIRVEARSNRPYEGDPRTSGPMEEAPVLTVNTASPVENVTIVIKKLR